MTTKGIDVRTRVSPTVFTQLEKLANLSGMSVYELAQEFITQGIQARMGTAKKRAHLLEKLAALGKTETAALEDLGARALERRMKEAPRLHPGQAIVAAFNNGDEEGARTRFNELTPRVQANVLHNLQKEAPDIAERLQVGDIEDP